MTQLTRATRSLLPVALLHVALSVAMLDSIITTSAVAQAPDVKNVPDLKQAPGARQTPDAQNGPPAQRGLGAPLAPTVHWIRVQSAEAKWQVARTFTDSRPVQRATLKLAADFCYATVAINGRDVLEVEPYVATQSLDVTAVLRRGENVVTVRVKTAPGPTAIALSLERRFADGSTDTLVTDQDWKAEAGGVLSDLGAVPDPLWGVGRRDATLSPDDNYDQWKQSLATPDGKRTPRFWTAPGFEVTTLRTAADDEGSWIALAFDDAGRATISREDRGLLRMTLDERRETVTRVERIDVPLEECRGLAYSDGWLFANANNSKAMYRLKIDDDGRPQEMTKLREFAGGVGHGRNDLALSGDAVYSIHGDSVDAPSGDVGDWTSPLRESRSAKPGREGHLVRVDRTSGKCDIVAAGLRNPYGIALNRRGDRFTFDADNEFDMGAPWYRPTRILNLVDGADIGYREATGSWPPRFHDQPDNTPPVIDIGRSSPTAVMFGENLRFPTEYRRALFVLDWTYGRVLAVHLAERGASWRAATELFLQGRPLNVTDIAAGPDGAMYLITGGRKTQSGLFRVRWTGGVDRSLSAGTTRHDRDLVKTADAQRVRAEAFSAAARRRDAVSSEKSLATTFDALDDADPIVRHAARVAMESAPVAEWRSHVMSAPPSNTALVGLMALARARESAEVGTLLDRLLPYQPEKLTLGRRFVWLRVLTLAQQTNPEAVQRRRDELIAALIAAWPASDKGQEKVSEKGAESGPEKVSEKGPIRQVSVEGTSDELRRRIALTLGDLKADALPKLAVDGLLSSDAQEDLLAGLLALRHQRTGWTDELRRRQFETLRRAMFLVGGQGMPMFQEKLRTESVASLTDAESQSLGELVKATAPVDEPLPPARPTVKQWKLADLAALWEVDATTDKERMKGDPKRGAAVFRDALCSRCHRAGSVGAAVGPDLTFVANRFSRRDMLESILAPSLSVAENYRNAIVVTDGGKSYTGRVVPEGDFRSQKLKLATDALSPSKIVEIDKNEIVEYRTSDVSPMPQGLLDTFTLDEIRDLLAFFEARGQTRE